MSDPSALIRWSSGPHDPLIWFSLRDLVFHLVATPGLLLPLLAGLLWIASGLLPVTGLPRAGLLGAAVLCAGLIYTPLGTRFLSSWLLLQVPHPISAQTPVAVLVGRGPQIALTTTTLAADLERQGLVRTIYVSGDARATAERLVALGVPPARVAGDNCARTTWENATLTTAWLRQENPGAPLPAITLITDPWQLPRAALAFQRQGVDVRPMAAPIDHLSAKDQNRLALRETAALILYRLQRRI